MKFNAGVAPRGVRFALVVPRRCRSAARNSFRAYRIFATRVATICHNAPPLAQDDAAPPGGAPALHFILAASHCRYISAAFVFASRITGWAMQIKVRVTVLSCSTLFCLFIFIFVLRCCHSTAANRVPLLRHTRLTRRVPDCSLTIRTAGETFKLLSSGTGCWTSPAAARLLAEVTTCFGGTARCVFTLVLAPHTA